MTNFLRAFALSILVLGATWLDSPTPVHADMLPAVSDAGPASDGAVPDAGPPREVRTGLPPFGCTVAGMSVSLGPSIALVLGLGLARRRARRR